MYLHPSTDARYVYGRGLVGRGNRSVLTIYGHDIVTQDFAQVFLIAWKISSTLTTAAAKMKSRYLYYNNPVRLL